MAADPMTGGQPLCRLRDARAATATRTQAIIAGAMKLALLSDIHSNLEALRACLAHAARQDVAQYVFLGDLVGYGADPVACLDIVMDRVARGALALRGNHDEGALGGLCDNMNDPAREAIYWTRGRITSAQHRFLAELPLTLRVDGAQFVHASLDRPQDWIYVTDAQAARRCLAAASERIVCAGHVHTAHLYFGTASGSVAEHAPTPGVPIPLLGQRRWLAITGTVGQPRDGNPAAGYSLLDLAARTLTFHRLPYDHEAAARKILAAGLPERLALRLARGH
jgi:diadenosine tetraphosphatase ApaH/serine/threonine PP2A family protein phosphatase